MKILIFAPHNDDEVLGVGGTIAKYAKKNNEVYVCEITSGNDKEMVKKIKNEAIRAHSLLGIKETIFLDLPVVGLKETNTIKKNRKILKVVEKIKPNIVFIPHKGDMHIDHREVAESVMVALRPFNNKQLKQIYAYETLSETEWNIPTVDNAFIPNVWSDISETIEMKLKAMSCFKSQLKKFPHPRSLKAIRSLSEYRGSTISVNNAESFMLIRQKI